MKTKKNAYAHNTIQRHNNEKFSIYAVYGNLPPSFFRAQVAQSTLVEPPQEGCRQVPSRTAGRRRRIQTQQTPRRFGLVVRTLRIPTDRQRSTRNTKFNMSSFRDEYFIDAVSFHRTSLHLAFLLISAVHPRSLLSKTLQLTISAPANPTFPPESPASQALLFR